MKKVLLVLAIGLLVTSPVLAQVVLVPVDIDIDIKPGSDPNSINCYNRSEVITVAILSTDTFDALTVDHTTVTFEVASEKHVNGKDGVPRRHEDGTLSGETFDGQFIEGTDAVRMLNVITVN